MPKQTSGKYEKILQAAIEVISEKGLDKASISDIVKRPALPKERSICISHLKTLSSRQSQKIFSPIRWIKSKEDCMETKVLDRFRYIN